jgi:putative peptide zinc metalloprotease protein
MTATFLSSSWHRVAKLKLRCRGHVRVCRHSYRGLPWYVVRDDLTGRTHRFSPAVYLFIGLMDGERSVDEIWSRAIEKLGDNAPTQDEAINLLAQLHAADLLQSNVSPDAQELFERRHRHAKAKLQQRFGSLLSIKIPLVDPDRFLERTGWLLRPMFGWFGALSWLGVTLPALVLAAMSWRELTGDIADQVLSPENLLVVALIFPVLKTLHELGHGYAAKIFGGTVHEIGVMLLVFAPVPYVDVSSAAAFRSKWRRVVVGAAGMLVELFIAALAFYLWLAVEPGLVRALCFNVMVVAGVSTLVFNGNPLLRYDAYYILSDLAELPNLAQQSTRYWKWLVNRRIFGADLEPPSVAPGERFWFILYAPLAFAYRLSIVVAIALFLAQRYFFVGVVIGLWAGFSGIAWPLIKAMAHVVASPQLVLRRTRAVTITFGLGAAIVVAILAVPLRYHTSAEGILWLPERNIVRASADGFVTALAVPSGMHVEQGELLVKTEEPDKAAAVRVLESEVSGTASRYEAEQFTDRVQAKITLEELTLLRNGLVEAQNKAAALQIYSPVDGVFVVPQAADLPGRFLHRGDVIGYIEQPESRLVRLVVTQANIDLVRNHLEDVEVKLPQHPAESWSARLLREVPAGSEELPSKALTAAGGGSFATDPRYPDQTRSFDRTFQFDLQLPAAVTPGFFGSRVDIRFSHEAEPLGAQWYRRLRQLFLSSFDA